MKINKMIFDTMRNYVLIGFGFGFVSVFDAVNLFCAQIAINITQRKKKKRKNNTKLNRILRYRIEDTVNPEMLFFIIWKTFSSPIFVSKSKKKCRSSSIYRTIENAMIIIGKYLFFVNFFLSFRKVKTVKKH